MPSPRPLPSPPVPPTSIDTPSSPCACSVDSSNEKTPLLSDFHHGSSIEQGVPLLGTISENNILDAGFVSAAKLVMTVLITAVNVKINDLIEKCIYTFTDDDREDKDELIFPLGCWDCDFVGQGGEAVNGMARLEGVVIDGNTSDGESSTAVWRNEGESSHRDGLRLSGELLL